MKKDEYRANLVNITAFHGGGFWDELGYNPIRVGEIGTTIVPADVLDAWYSPSPKVVEALRVNLEKLIHTCPPAQPVGLVRTLSSVRGIPEKNIMCGTGSSQLIFQLLQKLLTIHDSVMLLDPMYGEYRFVVEQVVKTSVFPYYLNIEHGFKVSIPDLASEITKRRPKLVVLVNPNSPTGTFITKTQIEELLRTTPASTTIVLDETYIEYIRNIASCESLVPRNSRLCILKSMSKIYALSGVRVGYLVASDSLIQKLQQNIPPWSVSLPAQLAAIEALGDWTYYQKRIRETKKLTKQLFKELTNISFLEPFSTTTNFILCRVKNMKASELVTRLKKEKIFLRNCDSMSEQFHDDFVRITVGSKDTNQRIVKALQSIVV